ncbi:MAG: hypothetical protein KC503_37195 [Myxococcales bacterium]|nr:hypothetical protein [Myxococcales bacterium]
MRIPISDIPQPIMNRLLDVQRDPSAYDGYYQKGGGRGGAITGIIVCGIIALLGIPMATSTHIPFPVWAIVYALLSVGIWASIRHLKRFANATLKPLIFLNPLYVVRTTLDEVRYYSLWNELKHLQITHHHTNGVYNYTTFEFRFDGGAAETITVRPKAFAEQLASMIDAYRQRMIAALEQQDFESIMAHDLFIELRMNDGQVPQSGSPKKSGALMTWAVGSAIGLVIGSGLWLFNYMQMQRRSLMYSCERSYASVESCQGYFNRWAIQFYTDDARDALTEAYKRYFNKNKSKVSKLRRMMLLKDVPHVTAEQKKEIVTLYTKGSRKALDKIYADIIAKYKASAKEADPKARAAIVKMIELARDNDLFRVRITYSGKTAEISAPIKLGPQYDNKVAVSAAPSFTPALNKSRESIISSAIEKAFNAIIPKEVLEFSHHSSKTYKSKYSYDYRSRFLPKLKKPEGKPDITFAVGYKVYRSGSVYSQRSVSRANKRYYVGVGFEWDFDISVKGERLHHFNERSRPPSTFSVRSYRRSGTHLSRASIYARMAETAFDNFSDKITRYFGIYRAASRYTPSTYSPSTSSYKYKYNKDLQDRLRRLRERLNRYKYKYPSSTNKYRYKYNRPSTPPPTPARPANKGKLGDMVNGM